MSSDLGVQRHFSTVLATCDNPIGRALRFLDHRGCTTIHEMQKDSDEFSDPDGELFEKPCKTKVNSLIELFTEMQPNKDRDILEKPLNQ